MCSSDLEKICFVNGLYLKRKTSVITREGQSPKRDLISFVRSVCVCENDVLTMTDRDGKCTEKYMRLVKEFYLRC